MCASAALRTDTLVAIWFIVHANSDAAWRAAAIVRLDFTSQAIVASRTPAKVSVDLVETCATVQTSRAHAVVDIGLTDLARETCQTLAHVSVRVARRIYARSLVLTQISSTNAHASLATSTGPGRWTRALVDTNGRLGAQTVVQAWRRQARVQDAFAVQTADAEGTLANVDLIK